MFEITSEASRNPTLANSLHTMYDEALNGLMRYFEDQKEKGIIRPEVNNHHLALGLIALQDGLQGYELFGIDQAETGKAWAEISNILLRSVMTNKAVDTGYTDKR